MRHRLNRKIEVPGTRRALSPRRKKHQQRTEIPHTKITLSLLQCGVRPRPPGELVLRGAATVDLTKGSPVLFGRSSSALWSPALHIMLARVRVLHIRSDVPGCEGPGSEEGDSVRSTACFARCSRLRRRSETSRG